jgi:hypothetical protein
MFSLHFVLHILFTRCCTLPLLRLDANAYEPKSECRQMLISRTANAEANAEMLIAYELHQPRWIPEPACDILEHAVKAQIL